MRTIKKIIIHCSATPEGRDHDAKDIDRWHRERGWSGIGYHWVIKLDGTIEPGRKESEVGAHTLGHNSTSIGVCYIGGLDTNRKAKDTRTDDQKIQMFNLLQELKERYPQATIHGHREFAAKDCPCFDARTEYAAL